MGQEVADRDVALAVALEAGHVERHRIGQAQPALLTSCITLVVVATTLVSDAASKTVSSVIASRAGSMRASADGLADEDPIAPCPTMTTAPGSWLGRMASSTSAWTRVASVEAAGSPA